MNNGVMAAFVVFLGKEEIYNFRTKLNDKNTIFQVEMVATLEAIHWCHKSNYNIFFLYTDSLSSLYAVEQLYPGNKVILEIFMNMRMLNKKKLYI